MQLSRTLAEAPQDFTKLKQERIHIGLRQADMQQQLQSKRSAGILWQVSLETSARLTSWQLPQPLLS